MQADQNDSTEEAKISLTEVESESADSRVERDEELTQPDSTVAPHKGLLFQELPPDIEAELDEDPDQRASCMEQIRTWITDNQEFYGRTDDTFILSYLRVSKFDVEKTKQRILRRYKIRHNYPKYVQRTEENERWIDELVANKFSYLMHYAGNSKTNLMVSHLGLYLEKCPVEIGMGTFAGLMTEILAEDPRLQVNGIQYIADLTGFSLGVILQLTPAFLWRIYNLVFVSIPMKTKGMHIINAPRIAEKIVYIFKFFLTKKLRSRFFVHKDLESLYKYISPECLPLELEGTAGPAQSFVDSTIEWFRNGKDVNAKNQLYGIDKHPETSDDNLVSE